MTALDLEALAELLRTTDRLEPVDVALALGDLGIPAVPTVPGGKDRQGLMG